MLADGLSALRRPSDDIARCCSLFKHSGAPATGAASPAPRALSIFCATPVMSGRSDLRICCLTVSRCAGCMENWRSPRPSSRRVRLASPAISPHTETGMPALSAAADGHGDQLQHRRVQRVIEVRHGIVGAVDRQGVLDQVVGADGQKIQVLGEGVHRQRRGGNFDHAADRDAGIEGHAFRRQLLLGVADQVQGLAQFGQAATASGSAGEPCRNARRAGSRATGYGTSAARPGTGGWRAAPGPGCRRCGRRTGSCLSAPRSRVRMVTGRPFMSCATLR